ncbi:MAG: hypothetical protein ACTS27_02055 [Phycisphaerales bacterium]
MIPTLPSILPVRSPRLLSRAAGCAFAACALANSALGAGIADVAPRDSFVVVELRDWAGLLVDLEASGAMSLWEDERIREYVRGLVGGFAGGGSAMDLEEELGELGISLDDLPPLGSSTGVAVFYGVNGDAEGRPVEGGDSQEQFLVLATLDGDEADDGRTLWEIVEEAMERSEDEGEIEVVPVDYGDADVYRIITRYEEEQFDENAWENWDPRAPDAEENFPEPKMVEVVEVSYLARAADHMIITTSFDAVRDTIDRLEGQDRGETVADVRAFADARDAGPAESHMYAIVMPGAMASEGIDAAGLPLPLPVPDAEAMRGVFDALGLTEVTALSMFLVADQPESVVEAHFEARMTDVRGVFTLLTGDPIPAAPPSFIGPDAAALGVFRVNFDRVLPLVRQVFSSMPDDPMMQGMQMEFENFAGQLEPLLNAIGPELIQVGTLKRPFSAMSPGGMYAIRAKNPDAVRDAINMLGGMAGLMPRDFAGSQIWESQAIPLSIGLGSGYAFVGETKTVESAMLAASQPDAPKLADDPRFTPAMRALGQGGIAMGWQDLKTALEYAAWRAENLEQVTRAEAEQFGMPPEQVEEYVQFVMEQTPESARTPPPVDAFTRVLGDIVSVFRATDAGIEGRVRFLRAPR